MDIVRHARDDIELLLFKGFKNFSNCEVLKELEDSIYKVIHKNESKQCTDLNFSVDEDEHQIDNSENGNQHDSAVLKDVFSDHEDVVPVNESGNVSNFIEENLVDDQCNKSDHEKQFKDMVVEVAIDEIVTEDNVLQDGVEQDVSTKVLVDEKGKGKVSESEKKSVSVTPKFYKRVVKIGQYIKSPYRRRMTDTVSVLKAEEIKVSNYFFSMSGSPTDTVFCNDLGKVEYRYYLETLIPGSNIDPKVIDLWSMILNDEEKYKFQSSLSRYYFPTTLIDDNILMKRLRFEVRFPNFVANLKVLMNNNEDLFSFKNIDLVFVPMLREENFYLLVLNLKNPSFIIFDNNSKGGMAKYSKVPDLVLNLFKTYLDEIEHKKAEYIAAIKPEIASLRWGTSNNVIDSGIFTMCHMDTFIGESLEKYNPKLFIEIEGNGNQSQLNRLRSKYLTKILLSDANVLKEEIASLCNNFSKLKQQEKDALLNKEKPKISERLKEFQEKKNALQKHVEETKIMESTVEEKMI